METTTQTAAATSTESRATRALAGRLQGILGAMSAEFLLGLALATVADYDAEAHTGNHVVHQAVLGLHVLLALGILVGATMLVVMTKKLLPKQFGAAVVGLVAVLVAIVCGMATLAVDSHEWFTFGMGTGFIVAIGVYGGMLGYVQLHQAPPSES